MQLWRMGGRFLEKVESLRKKSFFQLKYSINACAVYSFFPHVHDFFFAGWKNVARAAGYACRVGGKMLARSRGKQKNGAVEIQWGRMVSCSPVDMLRQI